MKNRIGIITFQNREKAVFSIGKSDNSDKSRFSKKKTPNFRFRCSCMLLIQKSDRDSGKNKFRFEKNSDVSDQPTK